MTKKKRIKTSIHSLKIRMLIAVIVSMMLAVAVFFAVRSGIINWVEHSYNAPEAKQDRLDGYLNELQEYVTKNQLSSSNTEEITRWLRGSRNVYLFLYKDNRLFFTGGFPEEDEEEETQDTENPENTPDDSVEDGDDTEEVPEDGDGADGTDTDPTDSIDPNAPDADGGDGSGELGTEDEELTDGDTEGDSDDENNQDDSADNPTRPGASGSTGTTRPGTGLTVTIPTKDEIIQHATDNGLKPLELSDGTLFASFVDFSDYFYYNMSTIVSIVSALLVTVIILMIYFHNLTTKITRLADDVSGVYEEDMNRSIRTLKGKDEISELTRNVEQMRRSMLDGLKKEREALDANSELITSMSHDIRTPLTVLLGYIDIMKTYDVDPELSEHIRAAENTALRLKSFSDDMFRYFLVFGGKELEVSLADYNAHTLFEQLLSEHLLLLRERGFTVDLNFSIGDIPNAIITTDAPKLMRVIDNLFSNLYKYAEPTRPVELIADMSGGVLKITLKNTVKAVIEAESSGVGLRTCGKICEALDIRFTYGKDDAADGAQFTAMLEFKVKTEDGKNGN